MKRRTFLAAVAAVAVGAAAYDGKTTTASGKTRPKPSGKPAAPRSREAAVALAYARSREGLPYLWGGTGPHSYDCSGLVMMAYHAARIDLPRTADEQWEAGPRVESPRPGDLVFFPGGDGTWAAPGHVAIISGHGRIIQAYAPGVPIGTYPYGTAAALPGTGPGTVIGYTRPWARA